MQNAIKNSAQRADIYYHKKVAFDRASKMLPHNKLTYPKKSSYNVVIII
jgi:hypothetical protein